MPVSRGRFAIIEAAFFKQLNSIAKPRIKAGLGSPGLLPAGLIVLETVGRKSGRAFEVPVVASTCGDYILIGTVRGSSQWIKNLAAMSEVDYWIKGKTRQARVNVFLPGQDTEAQKVTLPIWLTPLINALSRITGHTGGSFAILKSRG